MILSLGSAPFNQGKPVVNYGGIYTTGYPTYTVKTNLTQVDTVNTIFDRLINANFYKMSNGSETIFDNTDADHGLITELLIVNNDGGDARIYINQKDEFAADSISYDQQGGFPLGSGQSIQIRQPVTHIGQLSLAGTVEVEYNGIRQYNYNTI